MLQSQPPVISIRRRSSSFRTLLELFNGPSPEQPSAPNTTRQRYTSEGSSGYGSGENDNDPKGFFIACLRDISSETINIKAALKLGIITQGDCVYRPRHKFKHLGVKQLPQAILLDLIALRESSDCKIPTNVLLQLNQYDDPYLLAEKQVDKLLLLVDLLNLEKTEAALTRAIHNGNGYTSETKRLEKHHTLLRHYGNRLSLKAFLIHENDQVTVMSTEHARKKLDEATKRPSIAFGC